MHHFRDILELRDFLHKTDRRSYLSALWSQLYPGWYIWVNSSRAQGKAGRIIPLDLGAYLYRGQIERHSPCLPSMFRNKKSSFDELVSLLKLSEFRLLCLTHPGVQRCIEFGLDIDFIGLAQHYGLDTNYLDFTQDIDIACFFASCALSPDGDYVPFNGKGRGVIYRISHTHPEVRTRVVVIGKQPFRRPEKQKAWALEMYEFEDLEKFKATEIFTFEHSSDASQSIWQLFEDQLYPCDVVAEKVNKIANSLTIYDGIFNPQFELFIREKSKEVMSIQHFYGLIYRQEIYKLSNRPTAAFTSEELRVLSLEWDKYGEVFLQKVGAIGRSDGTRSN